VLNDQPFHSFLSGGTRRFDLRAVPVHDGLSLTWRDVTQRHQEAAALAASEARYRELAENATDVVYRTALDGTTEWVSEGVEKVLGFTPDEFVGRNGRDLVSPQDREFVELATAEVLAGKRSSARFRMPTKAGETRWVESTIHPVYDDEGQPVGFVGGWRDIQAEVEAEEKLDARVRTDDLTGLVNRGEVLARLTQLLSPANPHRGRLAVAFCDLDGFKAVNDARGHAVGDVLLQTVATRVRECVRAGDTVARMGGDEFLLVLDGIPDLPTATHVAEKVRDALRGPLVMDGRRVPVSVSIGVTMADPHDDVDGLIARADRAMYQAKQAGRDRVVAAT
jgi:diguanylate cyclase (GGDEF)-like protein/PAS domain S-box-containing protein